MSKHNNKNHPYNLNYIDNSIELAIIDYPLMITIGCYDHEKLTPSKIYATIELTYYIGDHSQITDDQLKNVIDYDQLLTIIKNSLQKTQPFNLLETCASHIIKELFSSFPIISIARITLRKSSYPQHLTNENSTIKISLTKTQARTSK